MFGYNYNKCLKKAIEDDTFYLTASNMAKKLSEDRNISSMLKLFKDWDSISSISYQDGCYLEDLINDPNYVVGIHRTNCQTDDLMESDIISSICSKGLINTGGLFDNGTYIEVPGLGKTISFTPNILNMIILLKSTYKGSNTAIIFAFPREYVDSEGNILPEYVDMIYNHDNVNYVKPEYIVSVVKQDSKHLEFYNKDEFTKERAR